MVGLLDHQKKRRAETQSVATSLFPETSTFLPDALRKLSFYKFRRKSELSELYEISKSRKSSLRYEYYISVSSGVPFSQLLAGETEVCPSLSLPHLPPPPPFSLFFLSLLADGRRSES